MVYETHAPQLKSIKARSVSHFTSATQFDVIVIGASTGGTQALQEVLANLPAGMLRFLSLSIFHPNIWAVGTAPKNDLWLALEMVASEQILKPGHLYLPVGDHHLTLVRRGAQLYAMLIMCKAS